MSWNGSASSAKAGFGKLLSWSGRVTSPFSSHLQFLPLWSNLLLALGGYEHGWKRQPAIGLLIPSLSQFTCSLRPLDLLVLPGDPGKPSLHTSAWTCPRESPWLVSWCWDPLDGGDLWCFLVKQSKHTIVNKWLQDIFCTMYCKVPIMRRAFWLGVCFSRRMRVTHGMITFSKKSLTVSSFTQWFGEWWMWKPSGLIMNLGRQWWVLTGLRICMERNSLLSVPANVAVICRLSSRPATSTLLLRSGVIVQAPTGTSCRPVSWRFTTSSEGMLWVLTVASVSWRKEAFTCRNSSSGSLGLALAVAFLFK